MTEGLQRSETVTKTAEGVIASARAVIVKAQTLIQDNEQKLANEKMEELETAKSQVQQKLTVYSSKLKSFQMQLAPKKLLSEEELRAQALVGVEKTRQQNIQHLWDQIKSYQWH